MGRHTVIEYHILIYGTGTALAECPTLNPSHFACAADVLSQGDIAIWEDARTDNAYWDHYMEVL